jgi:hypothetical protein
MILSRYHASLGLRAKPGGNGKLPYSSAIRFVVIPLSVLSLTK